MGCRKNILEAAGLVETLLRPPPPTHLLQRFSRSRTGVCISDKLP